MMPHRCGFTVGGPLFGLLALVRASFQEVVRLSLCLRLWDTVTRKSATSGLVPFSVPQHSVTGTPRHTTKYANYANYSFPPERASVPPARGKEILCSPYYILNLSLSPLSQINSYPRKTSHFPVS